MEGKICFCGKELKRKNQRYCSEKCRSAERRSKTRSEQKAVAHFWDGRGYYCECGERMRAVMRPEGPRESVDPHEVVLTAGTRFLFSYFDDWRKAAEMPEEVREMCKGVLQGGR